MKVKVVVDKLIIRQRAAEQTDQEFADRLGVSRQMWNFVKRGESEPGLEMWQKVVRVFPELARDILDVYKERIYGNNGGNHGG